MLYSTQHPRQLIIGMVPTSSRVGALQFSGWGPPVLGLGPYSSRVGALQFYGVGAQILHNLLAVSLRIIRNTIFNSQIEPQMDSLARSRSLEVLNMYHF